MPHLSLLIVGVVLCSAILETTISNSLPTTSTTPAIPLPQRSARQDDGASASTAAAGAATGGTEDTAGILTGTSNNVVKILTGVFQGDVGPILAGGAAFIPQGGVRDGVSLLLQQQVAPQVNQLFMQVGQSIRDSLNATTTPSPNAQNTNIPQYFNPDNNNNYLLANNGYQKNNFQQPNHHNNHIPDNPNFAMDDSNKLNRNPGLILNLTPMNENFKYQNVAPQQSNSNYNANNNYNHSQHNNNVNNQNNNESNNVGFQLPNPVQLIRDRLTGNVNNGGPSNPIQLLRDRLSGNTQNGGGLSNPLQLLRDRLNVNNGANGGSPLQAIQERIQSLLTGGNNKSNSNTQIVNNNNGISNASSMTTVGDNNNAYRTDNGITHSSDSGSGSVLPATIGIDNQSRQGIPLSPKY